jgi:hypothetical protein
MILNIHRNEYTLNDDLIRFKAILFHSMKLSYMMMIINIFLHIKILILERNLFLYTLKKRLRSKLFLDLTHKGSIKKEKNFKPRYR